MTATEGAILGIVQGLTEFLPVSSKGHLALVGALMGVTDQTLLFKIALHFGTLLSLFVYFGKDVLRMLRAFFAGVLSPREAYARDPHFRLGVQVILACIPAGIAGVLLEHRLERWMNDPLLTCYGLFVTAVILFSTRIAALRPEEQLTAGRALAVGFAQVFALAPGISRSGSTIAGGMWSGLAGPTAGKFSFLVSMPLIFGATLLEARKLFTQPLTGAEWAVTGIGIVCSCITGIFALSFLLAVLRTKRISWFGAYCAAVGVVGILLLHRT